MTKREGHLENHEIQVQQCFCRSVFEEGGTFNSTKGRATVRVGHGGGTEGVNKAKVYESKGTPNYRYTIHD